MEKIIVFGIGPNFLINYLPDILKLHQLKKIKIIYLVDLESQKKSILKSLENYVLEDIKLIFLPERDLSKMSFSEYRALLNEHIDYSCVTKAIISTEPKSHYFLSKWCIENQIDIFVDKPITAFNQLSEYSQMVHQYKDLQKDFLNSKVKYQVCCERRTHQGYLYIFDRIKQLKKIKNLDITNINIYYAGGNEVTKLEYQTKENHPYKYGYGILLHSGYHYVDLLCQLLLINNPNFQPESYNLKIINRAINHPGKESTVYGESNIQIMGISREGDDKAMFSLTLLDQSLSLRTTKSLEDESFSSFGRVRQESVIIQLGFDASIHIRSLPYRKLNTSMREENFDIDILISDKENGCHTTEKLTRSDISLLNTNIQAEESLNKYSRKYQLKAFLLDQSLDTNLLTHEKTMRMIDHMYHFIFKESTING